MLSSQFNSGYRHQLLKKPLVKGFFDAFIFKVYEKCTIFFIFVILVDVLRHLFLAIRIQVTIAVHRLFYSVTKPCGDVDWVKSLIN